MRFSSLKPIFVCLGLVTIFFWALFWGKSPFPGDTLLGLYHPWRDIVWDGLVSGVPFKNSLITDPVRQQYPWRELAVSLYKKSQMPLWNPYVFSGTPLLATLQPAAFYPLNIIFFIFPFSYGWSILVFSQPLLAMIFMFAFLRNQALSREATFFGSFIFAFSGFSIAWLTWNTLGHTILWLPLLLLCIDKIASTIGKDQKKRFFWQAILISAACSSFFAGHLQVFFYEFIFIFFYCLFRAFALVKEDRRSFVWILSVSFLLMIILTSLQWFSTFRFLSYSGRAMDQNVWQKTDWFIPWSHLIMFVVPDFFGNPTTLNYWGTWNYGEFIGYIGVISTILVLYALIKPKQNIQKFFFAALGIIFLLALPNPLAELPYRFALPFILTAQPSRLLSLIDFTLAVIAAFGLEGFLRSQKQDGDRALILSLAIIGMVFIMIWIFVIYGHNLFAAYTIQNLSIAQKNLVLPSIFFIISCCIFLLFSRVLKYKKPSIFFVSVLILIVIDLFRFGWKFTPFVKNTWIFPSTKIIDYLRSKKDLYRFMTTDDRLFPPNVSTYYRLQTVNGYDPLYLSSYGEFIAVWIRGRADLSPFAFNRILVPHDYHSPLAKLSNVGYVLSLSEERSSELELILREGETRLYKLKQTLPRAYLVGKVEMRINKEEAANRLFSQDVSEGSVAVVEKEVIGIDELLLDPLESATLNFYSENEVQIHTKTNNRRFLVLADAYYPTWKAFVDGKESEIYRTNFTFRGILVPKGEHDIKFVNTLL